MNRFIKKGFTLIELLVTIAVLAVVMAAVLGAINPQQKILAGRDAQTQSGIGQLATALQSWSSQSATGAYPTAAQGLNQLVTDGELQVLPAVVVGAGAWNYQVAGAAVSVSAAMQATRNTAQGVVWCWRSATNVAGFAAACAP